MWSWRSLSASSMKGFLWVWDKPLHLFPSSLEISAWLQLGVSSIILCLSIWLQTMKAFMGLLTWGTPAFLYWVASVYGVDDEGFTCWLGSTCVMVTCAWHKSKFWIASSDQSQVSKLMCWQRGSVDVTENNPTITLTAAVLTRPLQSQLQICRQLSRDIAAGENSDAKGWKIRLF